MSQILASKPSLLLDVIKLINDKYNARTSPAQTPRQKENTTHLMPVEAVVIKKNILQENKKKKTGQFSKRKRKPLTYTHTYTHTYVYIFNKYTYIEFKSNCCKAKHDSGYSEACGRQLDGKV